MNLKEPQLARPEDIFELVQKIMLQHDHCDQSEQRLNEHLVAFEPVTLQFIDQDTQPIGEQVQAITKDISVGGLGLIAAEQALGPKVYVRFETASDAIPVLLELQHCKPLGPFFQMGGKFCTDWS